MNIFLDGVPDFIEANGAKHEVNTGFDVWLRVIRRLESLALPPKSNEDVLMLVDAFADVADMVFERVPAVESMDSTAEILGEIIRFANGPKLLGSTDGDIGGNFAAFDFWQDSDAVYASFWQQYGIDLLSTPIHFWKFKLLLAGLGDNTPLARRIRLRSAGKFDSGNEEMRENLNKYYKGLNSYGRL